MKFMKKVMSALLASAMLFTAISSSAIVVNAADVQNEVDTEWYNFRNNPENNGVTDRPTPTEGLGAVQKWAKKYGNGWGAAPTPPLILNGKLYIGVSNQIIELDKETGEELRRSDAMVGNVGYAMNPLTYADGKLFAQVGNGVIQAVDLATLTCVWYSEKVGGQTICPISYATVDGKGYLYTGTWSSESRDGSYFCISTDDENLTAAENMDKGGGQIKKVTWQFTPSQDDPQLQQSPKRGFYWAGAYATETYIAVGSDDGTKEGDYTANAVFYTLNPKTGEIIDSIAGIKGDIRTTTVYDNGYLYFATKGGLLYKVKVDNNGNLSEESCIDIGAVTGETVMVTAAPVVYQNKIYMGVSGAGGQFDPDGGHGFRVIDNSGSLNQDSMLYNIPIPGYPQAAALASTAYVKEDFDKDGKGDGRVYLYFTYNANPGGIYYCYDTADQTESKAEQTGELFVPGKEQQNYCISTICADREGTLYYKNDSCYLMAVEKNPAYLDDITVTGTEQEAVVWNQAFHAATTEYELKIPVSMKTANIVVKHGEGATVTVDGEVYQEGKTVKLPEGDSEIVVVVNKPAGEKTYTRTYTLKMVRVKAVSTLESMKVGTMNSFTGFVEMTPEFSPEVTAYKVDTTEPQTFWRVWLKASDINSNITVSPIENVEKISTASGNPATEGHDRWNVYKKDPTKTAKIRVEVTSEDGTKTTNYTLALEVPVQATGVVLDQTEATFDVTETLQLQAKVLPEDATIQTVQWYTSDEEIATVSETGLVTPKKEGEVEITVVLDDGASVTAKCKVKITDQAAKTDALIAQIGEVTLEDKEALDIARAAYEALTEKQKARVTKLDILKQAEALYASLKEEAEQGEQGQEQEGQEGQGQEQEEQKQEGQEQQNTGDNAHVKIEKDEGNHTRPKSPQTGDTSRVLLWSGMCLFVLLFAGFTNRKHNQQTGK